MRWDNLAGLFRWQIKLPAVGAGDATQELAVLRAPFDLDIVSIDVVPDGDVTGDNTNTKNLNAIDRAGDDSGTTEVGNLDLVTGTNLAQNVASQIFDGSATAHELDEGDVLVLQHEQVGTGVALPTHTVEVTARNAAQPLE